MPVFVSVTRHSARLTWVLDLCSRLLGWEFIPVHSPDPAAGPVVRYGVDGAGLWVPDAGLLWETGTERPWPEVKSINGWPRLTFGAEAEFDLFSAVFWLVSEYASYQQPVTDGHGRYTESPVHSALRLGELPLVHCWLEELATMLEAAWPALRQERCMPTPRHRVTFDLDNPWKYLHKPLWVRLGGFGKDLLVGNWANLRERSQAQLSGKDPYDTFGQISQLCEPNRTTLFALIERKHVLDGRFTWQHEMWTDRLRSLEEAGFSVGIHPSYLASVTTGQIRAETEILANILGKDIHSARMHFLRYSLPDTRRELIRAGIREDLTLYRNGSGGFPNGMMQTYRWYDLNREEITDLFLVPTLLMDRTLVGTMPTEARVREAAEAMFRKMWKAVTLRNGSFVVCLHNECLSESGEWAGWSSFFQTVIRTLQSGPAGE